MISRMWKYSGGTTDKTYHEKTLDIVWEVSDDD